MRVTIDIPERLSAVFGSNVGAAAREALIIDAYRTGRISLGYVAEILGLSTRMEAQRWLADRHVPLNYDEAELEADRRTMRERLHVEL